jgi:hypothetical protein
MALVVSPFHSQEAKDHPDDESEAGEIQNELEHGNNIQLLERKVKWLAVG